MQKIDAVFMAQVESEIAKHKALGFAMFKPLKKKVCIESHSIEEDGIDFTLKTERNEFLNFTCNPRKINDFFANFEFAEDTEVIPAIEVEAISEGKPAIAENKEPATQEISESKPKIEPAPQEPKLPAPGLTILPEVNKTMGGIRTILFETLEGLRNGTTAIDKAKAISEVSTTLLYSAKVEIEYRKLGVIDKDTKDIKMVE